MRRIAAVVVLAAVLSVPSAATAKPDGYIGWGRPVGGWDSAPLRDAGEVRESDQPRRPAPAEVAVGAARSNPILYGPMLAFTIAP